MSSSVDSSLTFCREYVELAGDLASLGKVFLIAALVLGIAFGVVELLKSLQTRQNIVTDAAGSSTLKDLIDALKGFIEALAKAPAWIAMFGIGLLLFWSAGASVPEKCETEMNKPYGMATPTGTPAQGQTPGAKPVQDGVTGPTPGAGGGANSH